MSRLGLLVATALLSFCKSSGSFGIHHLYIFNSDFNSGSNGAVHFAGIFIVGFGLLVVAIGVHSYRTLRLLKKTPMTAIGSLSTGLVRICGKAVGAELLTSPITRLPCFYYRAGVGDLRSHLHGGGSPPPFLLDTRHVKFHLQDATGKVLIHLHQAELDLFETFTAETGPRASKKRTVDPSLGGWSGPSDDELLEYFSQANARIHAEQAARNESWVHATMNENSCTRLPAVLPLEVKGRHLGFNELCLLPDREYNILGTCIENPNPTDEHDRKLIARGGNWRHFVISCRAERALEKGTMWTGLGLLALGVALTSIGILVFLYVR